MFTLEPRFWASYRYIKDNTAKVFALASIAIFGFYFALSLPLGFAADEPTHAYRAYQFTQGDLLPRIVDVPKSHLNDPGKRVGGEISTGFAAVAQLSGDKVADIKPGYVYPVSFLKEHRWDKLENGPRAYMHFENTVLYSPANYVPQTITFAIARILNIPAVATLFLGRFSVVIFSLICAWLIFRFLPKQWHWPLAFVLTIPTSLTLGGSLSPDPIINGVTGVLAAYTVYLGLQIHRKQPITNRQYLALGILIFWTCLLKPPYIIMIGFPFLAVAVPGLIHKLVSIRKLLLVFLPGLITGVAWNAMISAYTVPYRNVALIDPVVPDAHAQMQYVAHHPLAFFAATLKTIPDTYTGVMVGAHGLVGQHFIPAFYGIMLGLVWFALLAVIVVILPINIKPSRIIRGASGLTGLGLFGAVYFLIYLSWSAVGAPIVDGIQGRYLIPLLPLLIFIGLGLWRGITNKWVINTVLAGMVCVTIMGASLAAQDNAKSNYNNAYNTLLIPKAVLGQLLKP